MCASASKLWVFRQAHKPGRRAGLSSRQKQKAALRECRAADPAEVFPAFRLHTGLSLFSLSEEAPVAAEQLAWPESYHSRQAALLCGAAEAKGGPVKPSGKGGSNRQQRQNTAKQIR